MSKPEKEDLSEISSLVKSSMQLENKNYLECELKFKWVNCKKLWGLISGTALLMKVIGVKKKKFIYQKNFSNIIFGWWSKLTICIDEMVSIFNNSLNVLIVISQRFYLFYIDLLKILQSKVFLCFYIIVSQS